MEFRLHPARERDYEELKQERDWDITKVAAGEDFIIMPPYASPPMASSLRKEVVFPPLYKPIDWRYAPRNFRPSSNPAASRARAERHNPCSIATIAFSSPGIFSSDSLLPHLLCTAPPIIHHTVVLVRGCPVTVLVESGCATKTLSTVHMIFSK
jgi:hypothetical protein